MSDFESFEHGPDIEQSLVPPYLEERLQRMGGAVTFPEGKDGIPKWEPYHGPTGQVAPMPGTEVIGKGDGYIDFNGGVTFLRFDDGSEFESE